MRLLPDKSKDCFQLLKGDTSIFSKTLPCLVPHKSNLSWSSYFPGCPFQLSFLFPSQQFKCWSSPGFFPSFYFSRDVQTSLSVYFLQPSLYRVVTPKSVSLHPDDLVALWEFVSNWSFYCITLLGLLASEHNSNVFHIVTKTAALKTKF